MSNVNPAFIFMGHKPLTTLKLSSNSIKLVIEKLITFRSQTVLVQQKRGIVFTGSYPYTIISFVTAFNNFTTPFSNLISTLNYYLSFGLQRGTVFWISVTVLCNFNLPTRTLHYQPALYFPWKIGENSNYAATYYAETLKLSLLLMKPHATKVQD